MLGYVEAYVPELKVREYQIYNGTYCGLCKTVGDRYGQIFRTGLSYDMSFLALLLGSLIEEEPEITSEHCVLHHIRKKTVLRTPASEYAADMMILLGWENVKDDLEDRDSGHRATDHISAFFLRKASKKAAARHPDTAGIIEESLEKLEEIEKNSRAADHRTDGALPYVADIFGRVTEAVFSWDGITDASGKRALSAFGRSFGRWLYLTDAFDDIAGDLRSGAYNPFLTDEMRMSGKPPEVLRAEIRETAEPLLYRHLGEMNLAFDVMTLKRNENLLRNIILLGLRRKTDRTLEGKKDNIHAEQRSL